MKSLIFEMYVFNFQLFNLICINHKLHSAHCPTHTHTQLAYGATGASGKFHAYGYSLRPKFDL